MSVSGEEAAGLIGRARELAALTAAFDEAAAGRGRVLLILGEPGIGKTTLATAFADWAGARGGRVCWGRAWEAGGAPAFWPWIEVLRELGRDPALWTDLPGLADLATLLPELRERFPALPPVPPADPAQARFRLFDAVAALLRRAAAAGPLAIVLDDLHAADVPSVELLRFLSRGARRAPIAILGTYREAEARMSEEAGSILTKIEREAQVLRPLRLGREDVAALVQRATGSAATDDLVTRLSSTTEGNPLFLVETLRLLRAQGGLGDTRTVPLAGGVREVIRERLAGLPDEVRALLGVASVLGRELDPALLATIADRSSEELRGPLDLAVVADVLARRDDGRLAFTHILLREVLVQALAPARRAALHLAVAEALERRAEAGVSVPAAELAHHFFEAAAAAGVERAVSYAERAAQQATLQLAFEDAVQLLDRAVGALPATAEHDARRCDLLLALGQARIRAGLDRQGREACEQAVVLARRLGDSERLARAALTYGEVFVFAALDRTLISLLEESLAALGPGDRPLTARLLARLAAALQPARDPEPPMAFARDAIAMARRLGDEPCRLAVLHAATSALLYFADPSERIPLNAEQIALAGRLGDKLRALRGNLRLAFDYVEVGDGAKADACILEVERVGRELRLPAVQWQGPMLRAMRATLSGRFAEAEEREAEARGIAAAADAGVEVTFALFRAGLYRIAARPEELAALEPHLREVLDRAVDPFYVRACLAAIEARLERLPEARAELARLAPDLELYENRPMAAWVGEAVAFAGEPETALRLYDMLGKFAHRNHCWGVVSMVCEGPISGVRAALAARLGRWDDADHAFADALARTEAMGARPLSARTRFEWARALVHRGRAEDAARARVLVEAAKQDAQALPLPGLRGPLDELAELLAPVRASAPPPAPSSPVAPPAPPLPNRPAFTLALEGEVWAVSCEGKVFRLKDSKGLQILAQLVGTPGREHHVTDLLAPPGEAGHVEDAGEVIDREAALQYRARLKDLQEELREAEEWGDAGRTERLREEVEFLAAELSRGLGLGGRTRKASSSSEKARVNVQRRLKDAISRIAEQHAGLGKHLEWAVKTGTFCSYSPA